MKRRLYVLLVLTLTSCMDKSGTGKNNLNIILDSLPNFKIQYAVGEELMELLEMRVFKDKGKYFAENISPTVLYHNENDTIGIVELDNNKLLACYHFIEKAKTLPHNCPQKSIDHEYYEIILPQDTITIRGNCMWDSLSYVDLHRVLFKERRIEIEMKRRKLINSLNGIFGTWYTSSFDKLLERDDLVELTNKQKKTGSRFLIFEKDFSFKSNIKKPMNLSNSDCFRFYSDLYLRIETNKKDNGNIFIVNTIDSQHIVLKYLWSDNE